MEKRWPAVCALVTLGVFVHITSAEFSASASGGYGGKLALIRGPSTPARVPQLICPSPPPLPRQMRSRASVLAS